MRFAFFGYDFSIDVAQRLVAEGHELMAIFTFPCDQNFSYNLQAYALADHLNVPITSNTVTTGNVASLIEAGCEVFLVAGYPRKIPPIDESKAYGLNVHPALLPRARGITPTPYIILNEPAAAGFTVHKLTPEYDAGDIIYQEAIPVDEYTDVEVLSARVALRTPDIIAKIFADLPKYWAQAKPQDENNAGLYPAASAEMRTLDWNMNAAQLRQLGRAFGRYGVIATVRNNTGDTQKLAVFQFAVWQEKHSLPAGQLMRSSPREIIITIADGYICLKDFQIIDNAG
jgi:methionyl-tRNA formyltransferase